MNNERNKRIITVLSIFTIIFTLMGGSLAYWNWSSTTRTGVAFTIDKDFSCSADGGGDINSGSVYLEPTANCASAIERTVTVTPTIIKDDLTISMDLWLNVNSIGTDLSASEYFKYAITTTQGNCKEGSEGYVNGGNFKGLGAGDVVNLFSNKQYTGTGVQPETYYLYIWLDAAETNNGTQGENFNFSLGGECTDNNTLSGQIMALADTAGSEVYHEMGAEIQLTEWASVEFDESDETGIARIYNTDRFDFIIYGCHSPSITLIPKINGNYSYTISGIYSDNYVTINVNGVQKVYAEGSDQSGDLGYLTSSDTIVVTNSFVPTLCYGGSSVTISLVDAPTVTLDEGYRYEGETADNYITFNDETWRIIGVQEGGTIGLESGKYYTKIIRNEALKETSFQDLQGIYSFDNCDEEYDDEIGDYVETNCTIEGIQDRYLSKIVKAKWYTLDGYSFESLGHEDYLQDISTPSNTYLKEKSRPAFIKKSGLLSPSDYGFSALQSECSNINLANFNQCGTWLYNGNEWLLSSFYDEGMEYQPYIISSDGSISYTSHYDSLPVRPVVYLNSDVKLIGGSGKIGDEYKIS